MTDQADRPAVHSSLRDLLRALEKESDDWTSDAGWKGPQPLQVTSGALPAPQSECLPDPESEAPAGWMADLRDRVGHWSPAAVMAVVVPVMGLLFFSALISAPTGADWRWAATLKESAGPSDTATPAPHHDGLEAFARLGRRAFTVGAEDLYRPVASSELPVEPASTPDSEQPFAQPAAVAASDGQVLPATPAELLAGKPNAPDPEPMAVKVKTSSERAQPAAQATAPVTSARGHARPKEIGSGWVATVTAPLPGTQILTIQGAHQQQSAPPALATPEWMQPWNRSALGGAF